MASLWTRTAAELLMTRHYVQMHRKDERSESWSSAEVPWPKDRWIRAEVWRQSWGSWRASVWVGSGKNANWTAEYTSGEGGARAGVKRYIAPHVAENMKRFTTSVRVAQFEEAGYSRV